MTAEESAVLDEVAAMGIPTCGWFGRHTMGAHAFSVIYPTLLRLDAAYFNDFWTTPSTHAGCSTTPPYTVASLLDREAYPWQADWYARAVETAGGVDRFRL